MGCFRNIPIPIVSMTAMATPQNEVLGVRLKGDAGWERFSFT